MTTSPCRGARAVDQRRRGRRGRPRCRRSRSPRRGRCPAARPSRRRGSRSRRRGRRRRRPRRAPRPAPGRSCSRRRSRGRRAARRRSSATSLMPCAARSAPHQRSFPARRPRTSFEPTESVEAASRRRSSIAKSPANAPKRPRPPASASTRRRARRRSTTALGGRERDACGGVRLVVRRHGASVVDRPARASPDTVPRMGDALIAFAARHVETFNAAVRERRLRAARRSSSPTTPRSSSSACPPARSRDAPRSPPRTRTSRRRTRLTVLSVHVEDDGTVVEPFTLVGGRTGCPLGRDAPRRRQRRSIRRLVISF